MLARNPSKPRKQDRAITFLTQEEVQRLFSVIKTKRDRAIFAVAYRHDLRASEVGMLQRIDPDLKQWGQTGCAVGMPPGCASARSPRKATFSTSRERTT